MKSTTNTTLPRYELQEDGADDVYNVAILDGVAAGLVFRFRNVRFDPGAGELKINYSYELVHVPESLMTLTRAQVQPIMSSILDDILRESHGQH